MRMQREGIKLQKISKKQKTASRAWINPKYFKIKRVKSMFLKNLLNNFAKFSKILIFFQTKINKGKKKLQKLTRQFWLKKFVKNSFPKNSSIKSLENLAFWHIKKTAKMIWLLKREV